jgi:hypothetical protein
MITRRAALATSLMLGTMATMASAQELRMNLKEWDAASNLLLDAAALIQKNGWQQGATTPVSQECLATALEKAFRANANFTLVDLNYAKAILDKTIGTTDQQMVLAIDTSRTDKPAVPYWGAAYMEWNDKPGQTQDAVIGALRNAASEALVLAKQAAAH